MRAMEGARRKAKSIMTLIIACIVLAETPITSSANQPTDKAEALRELVQRFSPESDWELDEIMNALIRASEMDASYKVLVIDVPFANAITLPTNEILITERLLSLLHTVDEVAFVLAHELAHAIRGDAKRVPYSSIPLGKKPLIEPYVDRALLSESIRAIAGLIRSAYSQELECTADELAIKLMAKAGFDARASLSVLERLSHSEAAAIDAWLSTHPSAAQRLQRLAALPIPEPQYRIAIRPPKGLVEVIVDLDIQIPWFSAALSEMMKPAFNECLSEQLKGAEVDVRLAKPWQRRRAMAILIKLSLCEQRMREMEGMSGWLIWTQKIAASVYAQSREVKSDELELVAAMRDGEKQSDVMKWYLKGIAVWLAKLTREALTELKLKCQ